LIDVHQRWRRDPGRGSERFQNPKDLRWIHDNVGYQ
jgi:hypothetical protein